MVTAKFRGENICQQKNKEPKPRITSWIIKKEKEGKEHE